MNIYTLDQAEDLLIGKKGSVEREEYEMKIIYCISRDNLIYGIRNIHTPR